MRVKRLLYYLGINVLVSACTIFAVIQILDRYENSMWPRRTPQVVAFLTATPPAFYQTATAQASITPEPTPTRTIVMYQVKAGDTLGAIAIEFGVSIESIMQENGLVEAENLGSGQVLFIPLSSQGMEEASDVPVSATGEEKIKIVYVLGAGDLNSERVRFERLGEGNLSLAGWVLHDEDGNQFAFPQLSLFPGAVVDLYSGVGRDTVMSLYWGLPEAIWSPGEMVTLLDDQARVQASFTVPQ